ncbi:MAG: hypothetical protein IT260_06805 [Saprospiraceae bacterium]|nr:hypothetical protein [Saprospiraceae bacterium]
MRYLLFAQIALLLACAGPKNKTVKLINLEGRSFAWVMDSTEAANALLQDRTDRFFERVTPSEMSIQMKQPLSPGQTRQQLAPAFQQFLRRDVESFSAAETALVSEVIAEMYATCNKVAPGIFPDTLKLIKTKGTHYGESVYYTREKCIIIPADVLDPSMRKAFTTTMYHELFHVYSRQNPEKRRQLYKLIGFEGIGLDNLRLPGGLAERVLYNPDGADFAQKITLSTKDGKTIEAIPVIYANNVGFKTGKRDFFGYVEFNLYQVEKNADGSWKVLAKPDGYSSILDLKNLPDFFRQIKDNTGYIIHPDEVLADNFSFLMEGKNNPAITAKFSAEGKKLIEDFEAVLVK